VVKLSNWISLLGFWEGTGYEDGTGVERCRKKRRWRGMEEWREKGWEDKKGKKKGGCYVCPSVHPSIHLQAHSTSLPLFHSPPVVGILCILPLPYPLFKRVATPTHPRKKRWVYGLVRQEKSYATPLPPLQACGNPDTPQQGRRT
jgi:hypothetical protein